MPGRERNRRVQKQVLEFRRLYWSTREDWWAVDAEDWAPNGERRGVKTPFCSWSGSEQAAAATTQGRSAVLLLAAPVGALKAAVVFGVVL